MQKFTITHSKYWMEIHSIEDCLFSSTEMEFIPELVLVNYIDGNSLFSKEKPKFEHRIIFLN